MSTLVDVHLSHGPQNYGEEVTGEQLHEILKEIDTNMNGQVELDEYLQVYIALLWLYYFLLLFFGIFLLRRHYTIFYCFKKK